MASGTLDALRRQILRLLRERGATQRVLARAVGHSPAWLSMILRGKREIRFTEIDQIAAYFEVLPAALFTDPDLPAQTSGKESHYASHRRPLSYHAARIKQQQELIKRQQEIIRHQQRTVDDAFSHLRPLVNALEKIASVDARGSDRQNGAGDRGDRRRRPGSN